MLYCTWSNPEADLKLRLLLKGIDLVSYLSNSLIVDVDSARPREKETLIVLGGKDSIEEFKEKLFRLKANLGLWIKEGKYTALTLDGGVFDTETPEDLIYQVLTARYYQTKLTSKSETENPYLESVLRLYPKFADGPRVFGTFGLRMGRGFLTTTRGKNLGTQAVAYVSSVDHENLTVDSDVKATLNAPLLHKIFELNPEINFLVHGHELRGIKIQKEYQFPGTSGDNLNAQCFGGQDFEIELPYHGYIAGFKEFKDFLSFQLEHSKLWSAYSKTFPSRYFKTSVFDGYIVQELEGKSNLKILDVGGGVEGTKHLDCDRFEVHALDKYAKPPSWVKQSFKDYKQLPSSTYDYIICRGSFNYLEAQEIKHLKRALKFQGKLLANSFGNAPSETWQNRKDVNLRGVEGIESYRAIDNIVEHRWEIPQEGIDVTHWFYIRSLPWIEEHLPGAKTKMSKNSLTIEYVHE